MLIKINGDEIASYPSEFSVTVLDLDDADSTTRTADGSLTRDRIAVKRQIEMAWPAIRWSDISTILQAMDAPFFEVYFPDTMTGDYVTKTMYVGNRPAPVAIARDGEIWWGGLRVTLTEK